MKRILLPLCILMAVLIIVISMTTISFSWFAPGSDSGPGLKFDTTTFVSSTDCSLSTDYETSSNDGTVSLTAGNTMHFKTVIKNSNKKYGANVSLYLNSFTVNDGGKSSLAVIVPTNTYRTYTDTQTDLHIIRNAYITELDTSQVGYGELEVEWFVTCESGTVTFNPSELYLMYD